LGNIPRGVCLDPHFHCKRTIPRLSVELPLGARIAQGADFRCECFNCLLDLVARHGTILHWVGEAMEQTPWERPHAGRGQRSWGRPPPAQILCETTEYPPAAGWMSTNGVPVQNNMRTHSSQPSSRRFGCFPCAMHCEAAEALSLQCTEMREALLAVGRCVWVREGPRRRPVQSPFPSTKEPFQQGMWAIRASICGQLRMWEHPKHRTKACGYLSRDCSGRARGCAQRAAATQGCATTHTEIDLCGAVQAGDGSQRVFSWTRRSTHSIFTYKGC
jgi:hypothetical protein